MTVPTTTNEAGPFVGNGVQTVWSTTFRIDQAADLQVIYTDVNGVDNTLSAASYSVTGFGNDAGIQVTYPLSGSPISASEKITLYRMVAYDQQTSIVNQAGFYPQVLERAIDRVVYQTQQLANRVGKALVMMASSSYAGLTVPDPVAGMFLRWNAALTGLENASFTGSGSISIPVPVAQGGTQATTAAGAASNLGSAMAAQLTTTNKTAMQTGLEVIGKHMVPALPGSMLPAVTNGATFVAIETTTNKLNYRGLSFVNGTQQFAWFSIPMPSSWNESTITFRPVWTCPAGSTGNTVNWALAAVACGDGDAIDAAVGAAITVSDTVLAVGQVHRGATSAAVTIAGSPATSDMVFFRVSRPTGDTLAQPAILLGLEYLITTDAGIDA